jgi:hypothetical protein
VVAWAAVGCSGGGDGRVSNDRPDTPATHVRGLRYVNEAGLNERIKARIDSTVFELAQRSFRGAPDVVHGVVYAPAGRRVDSEESTGLFLLVLPGGDREVSEWNDTAAMYLLDLQPTRRVASSKFRIARGPDRDDLIVLAFELDSAGTAHVLGCMNDRAGNTEYFRLSSAAGHFVRVPVGRPSPVCPPGSVLP